ncbi:hypothetical protein TREMEDRAFT_63491 [Tremella mesenterica DSM 1558]|uniref:uncharacterized protein n=1 Tax=Tremella mesenterica (strain ATCC 24925 / CBS 8224 / DSM 1558 / NBRC 9311 / NRRL Y-6157 / RJB 2259-6 / UBC 559-6) TaxID=578456 RepID=UPI0003F48C5A|nr:uncharacterized protein TREMEDRAFT_63491 [Tremella mesenterica DSM 1558]EIW68318.1 hypothetical protein TREMEDRAFT_63491 [Tremella mesenterica DSM 1558]
MSFRMILNLVLSLFFLSSILVTARPTLSNAALLKRGLPPKPPLRRYNATATRHYLPKRSTDNNVYLRASPIVNTKRDLSEKEMKERAGTPFDTVSYLYFDTSTLHMGLLIFTQTINPSDATPLYITGTGEEQDVSFVRQGITTFYIDTSYQGGKDFIGNMEPGIGFETATPIQYGTDNQVFIWTIPSTLPGSAGLTYHNIDRTKTTNAKFFVVTSSNPDTGSYSNVLGAALQQSDFSDYYTATAQQVDLTWVTSVYD